MRQARGRAGGKGLLPPRWEEGATGDQANSQGASLLTEEEPGPPVVPTHGQENRQGVSATPGPQQAGEGWSGPWRPAGLRVEARSEEPPQEEGGSQRPPREPGAAGVGSRA